MTKIPEPPAWLSATAARRWHEIWASADPRRIRPENHSDEVAVYCVAFGAFADACEQINASGMVSKNGDKPNPYVAIRDRNCKIMMKLSWQLGLSPSGGSITWPEKVSP